MSLFQETEKNRTLGQAKNLRLGDFMTPSGTGNATPDYAGSSGLEYIGQGLEAFGRGVGKVGDLMNDAKKKQQQDEQNKAESDMYLDVYNIQRTPSDMMTASQKEIAIDKVVNKYYGIVPVAKIHSILNANGAEPEKTYTRMSEQAAKQQSVQKQVDQNEQLSKLATTMDPSYMSASFSSQISAGRIINRNISLFTAAMDKAISLGPNVSDQQSIIDRDGTFDEAAQWARGFFPKEAREKYYKGQWTEKDTFDYINGFAQSLSQKVNPVTGTVLSKQEADFYAREVAGRTLSQMDKIKLDSTKHTLEYQNAVLDVMANDLAMAAEKPEDIALYVMTRKSPDMLAQVFGTATMRASLAANMDKIGMTSNGHVMFPTGLSNQFISLMADNNEMPLQQADSVRELFSRHNKQQPTLNGSRNSLELIDSRPENWLISLPDEYAKQNIDIMKEALPKDISLGIQSLVQARLAPQPNEGWFMRAFRAINNEAVDEGTYTSPEDMARVRGVNAEAINSMLNQYVNSLERIGVPEADINDIISSSIQMAGIPKGDGNSRSVIRMAVNSIANGVTEPLRKTNPIEAMGNIATSVAQAVSTPSNTQEVKEPELDTIKEQPKEVDVGNGKVDVSSIYDSKAYKLFVKNLVKEVKENRMTEDQAKNEMSVFLSKIGDAFSSVFGVKTAKAEELPVEIVQQQYQNQQPFYGDGNIDLNNRKVLINKDGSFSTENSITITEGNQDVLIPTVVNGKQLSDDKAIEYYNKTGEYLKKGNREEVEKYANELHERQETFYSPLAESMGANVTKTDNLVSNKEGIVNATTNEAAINEANAINKFDTKPIDSELYDRINKTELSDNLRKDSRYVSGDNYVIHTDKPNGKGNPTVGGGVLLNDTNKQLLRLAGYKGSFDVGSEIPQRIVDSVSKKLFNYKAQEAIRICNKNGIDLNKHPEMAQLCMDANYNGALGKLLKYFRTYVNNPSKKTADNIVYGVQKEAPQIRNNKERFKWWKDIANKLGRKNK